MNTFDIVNLYYHFILNPGPLSFKRVYDNYENLESFKRWLRNNHINLPFVLHIFRENYEILKRAKGFEKYDTAFHTEYQKDYDDFIEQEKDKYQVLILSKDKPMSNLINVEDHQNESLRTFVIDDPIDEDLSIDGPYCMFYTALYQVDKWPGVLVFKGDQSRFIPVDTKEQIDMIFDEIKKNTVFNTLEKYRQESYMIQLSDLHLGAKETDNALNVLNDSLDEIYRLLPRRKKLKFLITGDLMNSPNRKNMYKASSFMNRLKKAYHGDVTFVLGNHDVIVHGLNIFKRQKTKVVAYLLGENIKVFYDLKVVVIKIDSTAQGNLARGKVGTRNLQEIEEELMTIDDLEEYTIIVMLHHHLLPLRKDEFLKTKWNEKLFMGKIADSTKALVDADEFLRWLKKHHIKYIFHGHKHVPCIVKKDDMYIMACGSSCGGESKEQKSRYLSYNLVKYDELEKGFKYCFIFYDDITKQERHRVKVTMFKGE